jgi:hypothetical protein
MSYRTTENDQKLPPWLLLTLAATFGLLAGPSIVLGAVFRLALKRVGVPQLIWFLLALSGLGGAWFMLTHAGYAHALQIMARAFPPLSRWDWPTGLHFFLDYILPLWLRSLLLTPLCTTLWELILLGSLEEQLLDHGREEQAARDQATMRAKRAARRVPAQVGGQAVIGVVVKSPNNTRV